MTAQTAQTIRKALDTARANLDSIGDSALGEAARKLPMLNTIYVVVDALVDAVDTIVDDIVPAPIVPAAPAAPAAK
jgi:hypothetical protein